MAIPLVSFVASAVGGAVLTRAISPTLDYAFTVEPTKRTSLYEQNWSMPNTIPSVDVGIKLFHSGYLGDPDLTSTRLKLQTICNVNGVNVFYDKAGSQATKSWTNWVHLLRAKPSAGEVLALYHQGVFTRAQADRRLKELGYSRGKERNLLLRMESPLSQGDVLDLFHRGTITEMEARQRLKALGIVSDESRKLLLERTPAWTMPDIKSLHLRGSIRPEDVQQYLRDVGMWTDRDYNHFKTLEQFSPPPSDLIRFAVKDVFDPNLPDRQGMLDEFEEQAELKDWFRTQGIGEFTFTLSNGEEVTRDVGQLYWLASFELPSPTQAYQMLQRLRPNRVARYELGQQGGRPIIPQPVLIEDVRALLKDKDYRPGWRDRLAAISFLPPQKRDIQQMYKDGVYGDPRGSRGWERQAGGTYRAVRPAELELYDVMLDRGYSPFDAGQIGYETSLEYERKRGGKPKQQTVALLCQSFKLGSIDEDQLRLRLLQAGVPALEVDAIADNCVLQHRVELLSKAVAAIRAAFLAGRIDRAEAGRQLNGLDVNVDRRDELLRLWDIELQAKRKEATASEMCKWLAQGLITQDEMGQRLRRLGWSETDVARIIRHCVLGINAQQAKDAERRAAAEARERLRLEQALLRARERFERMERQEQARLRQAAIRELQRMEQGRTPERIKRYYRRGVISRQEILAILLERGWTRVDADRWLVTELGNA